MLDTGLDEKEAPFGSLCATLANWAGLFKGFGPLLLDECFTICLKLFTIAFFFSPHGPSNLISDRIHSK